MKIIFVFGSNLAGRHGKGAAAYAMSHHGAIYGQGEGLQGRSYAIPTKNARLKVLDLNSIKKYVDRFLLFAAEHPSWEFRLTAIGCGLAGYHPIQIAPMFLRTPDNVIKPKEFQ